MLTRVDNHTVLIFPAQLKSYGPDHPSTRSIAIGSRIHVPLPIGPRSRSHRESINISLSSTEKDIHIEGSHCGVPVA
ncbi:hypothetical protein H5410_043968 [Solanum commersonii]|uniref:Uncharacterized protein n=1 Tax=Solanum commersonii TaxID=4109 RepID=A0A9J5Y2V0_SOLCO|nr:hypothetical protein H5410_043968 [Solanum commersonii]